MIGADTNWAEIVLSTMKEWGLTETSDLIDPYWRVKFNESFDRTVRERMGELVKDELDKCYLEGYDDGRDSMR